MFKIAAYSFCTLLLLYALGFLATGGDLAIYSFWAPKQANAENRVFHETQQYTDGKITYIGRLCSQSANSDGLQKKSIDSEILTESSTIDIQKLPLDEQNCVTRAKGY